jgi:hypothetical protein
VAEDADNEHGFFHFNAGIELRSVKKPIPLNEGDAFGF